MNETHSRRDNLRFLGIPEQANETSDKCQDIMAKALIEAGIPNVQDITFARVHRVGPPHKNALATTRPRPIIAKFQWYRDRMYIWENKTKFAGKSIHIEEDFPYEIQQRRSQLYPIMRAANAVKTTNGQSAYKATLAADKLIINSKPYTIDTLHRLPPDLQPEALATQQKGNMVCFWSSSSPFSNHYIAPFTLDNKEYNCVEQFLMYHKAITFNNNDIAKKILSAKKASEHKALGKTISPFDGKLWRQMEGKIARKALHAKFSQNEDLRRKLLSTGTKELVEAGPHWEKIWGAGLRLHDKDITVKEKWNGKNLLGTLLGEVRDELRQ